MAFIPLLSKAAFTSTRTASWVKPGCAPRTTSEVRSAAGTTGQAYSPITRPNTFNAGMVAFRAPTVSANVTNACSSLSALKSFRRFSMARARAPLPKRIVINAFRLLSREANADEGEEIEANSPSTIAGEEEEEVLLLCGRPDPFLLSRPMDLGMIALMDDDDALLHGIIDQEEWASRAAIEEVSEMGPNAEGRNGKTKPAPPSPCSSPILHVVDATVKVEYARA